MISDFIDPATENWQEMDDSDVWHAAQAGIPQAVEEVRRREQHDSPDDSISGGRSTAHGDQ